MKTQAILIGASQPFKSNKTGKEWQNVHLMLPAENKSEGMTAHPLLMEPVNFHPGKEPGKYPRDCTIDVSLQSTGKFQINAVYCD